jgi:hypothetical protein
LGKTGIGKVAEALMIEPVETNIPKNMVQVCDLDLKWVEVWNFREARASKAFADLVAASLPYL